jgi:hypothetical protein
MLDFVEISLFEIKERGMTIKPERQKKSFDRSSRVIPGIAFSLVDSPEADLGFHAHQLPRFCSQLDKEAASYLISEQKRTF